MYTNIEWYFTVTIKKKGKWDSHLVFPHSPALVSSFYLQLCNLGTAGLNLINPQAF